jgi:peptidoglycan/xylan/chitin deacetylase (PgdA/CDA1 family)
VSDVDRIALLTFDFESRWGMPHDSPHDLDRGTARILEVLAGSGAHATFFVVGELATRHPHLIAAIAGAGHEVALHGWRHEDLSDLDERRIASFRDGLDRSVAAVSTAIGTAPQGFRAPYLLAPRFHNDRVHELLVERGFRFTSNRELRHPVELLRPDRLGSERPWRMLESRRMLESGPGGRALLITLNPGVWLRRGSMQSPHLGVRWLRRGAPPFYRDQILEIPLYTPMDCDLIGLPRPQDAMPSGLRDFARAALRACLETAGPLTMLTFHDWIVAREDRLELLQSVLSSASAAGRRVTTVRDAWRTLLAHALSEAG